MPPAATPNTPAPTMDDAQRILEQLFGYNAFRLHQSEIIDTLLNGGDSLALMPTGGGKSLCYQIPALARSGTGIVVSPLIALMQDQVDALRVLGIDAAFLNSSLSFDEERNVVDALRNGNLDLLYVAPERLVQDRTLSMLDHVELSLIAIDEAHCVSQWGHDFRPEYRQLKILAQRFPNVPRIALTATADVRTREEIATELRLENASRFVSSFDRHNIRYIIDETGNLSARERLWRFLEAEHENDAGIIYCLSRKSTEETAAWLTRNGRTALCYHAGMAPNERRTTQTRFLNEDGIVVVATTAFGMGIDKPDVRFVAHLNLPKTIESYYQETGRAGRDGEPASAWMAFGFQDIVKLRKWNNESDGSEAFKRIQNGKLDALVDLTEMAGCRRQALLAYFDENLPKPCGNCDNCLNPPKTIDATKFAQMALSTVYRTGQRYGVSYVVDVLLGKTSDRVTGNRHDELSVFGIGTDLDTNAWRSLVRQLTSAGFLETDADGYGTLALTKAARPLLRGEATFEMREPPKRATKKTRAERRAEKSGKSKAALTLSNDDQVVFEALKKLRTNLAAKSKVPPFVICHDSTLRELAQMRPQTIGALPDISGLGTVKVEKYGEALVEVLQTFKRGPSSDTEATPATGTPPEKKPAPAAPPNNLTGTVNTTLDLHRAGHDLEAISEQRNIKLTTVLGHFAEAIEAGLLTAVDVLTLDDKETEEIHQAFEEHDVLETGKLKPVFDSFEGKHDYGTLKCLLAELI